MSGEGLRYEGETRYDGDPIVIDVGPQPDSLVFEQAEGDPDADIEFEPSSEQDL